MGAHSLRVSARFGHVFPLLVSMSASVSIRSNTHGLRIELFTAQRDNQNFAGLYKIKFHIRYVSLSRLQHSNTLYIHFIYMRYYDVPYQILAHFLYNPYGCKIQFLYPVTSNIVIKCQAVMLDNIYMNFLCFFLYGSSDFNPACL